jgi:hypothetical protein
MALLNWNDSFSVKERVCMEIKEKDNGPGIGLSIAYYLVGDIH